MSKNLPFIQSLLEPWQALTALMVVGVLVLGSGTGELIHINVIASQAAIAQSVNPGDIWQQVYQQLPDFPRENKYISKDTGKVAENNTLANRLIRYHIYTKGRAPNYRLDWKLTLADYLGANEIMYDNLYPGNDTLRQNPMEGDRAAITRLNRRQREALVKVLANLFNPNSQNTSAPSPNTSSSPQQSAPTIPQQPKPGDAQLLK